MFEIKTRHTSFFQCLILVVFSLTDVSYFSNWWRTSISSFCRPVSSVSNLSTSTFIADSVVSTSLIDSYRQSNRIWYKPQTICITLCCANYFCFNTTKFPFTRFCIKAPYRVNKLNFVDDCPHLGYLSITCHSAYIAQADTAIVTAQA